MRRRLFIQNLSLLGFGTVMLTFPYGCSKKKETIDSLIGKDVSLLKQYEIKGSKEFSYVNFKGNKFDTEFNAKKAVIYLENELIVGYTLDLEKNIFKKLEKKYGQAKQEINNHFDEKWIWQTDSIIRSLTLVKPNSLFLYSCYSPDNNLIVF